MMKSMKKMAGGGNSPSDSTSKKAAKPAPKKAMASYDKPTGIKTSYKEVKNPLTAGSTRMQIQTKNGKVTSSMPKPKKTGGMMPKAPAKKAKGGKAC